jgi:hypothetical protein
MPYREEYGTFKLIIKSIPKMKKQSFIFFIMVITMMSCDKCKETEPPLEGKDYSTGIWFINEGAFNGNNASIDVRMTNGEIIRDVFQAVNGFPLGDVLQRVVVQDGIGYAVMNNSNKVVVFNAKTFALIREIDGLDYPRDLVVVNGKIFIAQGAMQGKVAQYTSTGQWINEVEVGNGPERLLYAQNRIWVLNSGGWLTDNRVQTIDPSTMTVDHTWTIGDRPIDVEYEPTEGAVFVLSGGEIQYDANWNIIGHTSASLSKFVGFNMPISVNVGEVGEHPRSFAINSQNNTLLLANTHLDVFESNLGLVCADCILGDFYSVDADDNGQAYLSLIPDFTNASEIEQYRLSDYSFVREFEGGIGTNQVVLP